MVRGRTETGVEKYFSNNTREFQFGGPSVGAQGMGSHTQPVVEFSHGCAGDLVGSIRGAEQAREAIRDAHWDESGWIIQERMLVDFRGIATAHLGNHPTLKLIQIMALVRRCDVLLNCREDILNILEYMMIWKPDWMASKDLLRRMGWSMVEAAAMNANPSKIKVPLGQFVKMNVLLRNCREALNPDFKRRIFEMAINHRPAILVVTETRVGGDRAAIIIDGLHFDGFVTIETIGYAGVSGFSGSQRKWRSFLYLIQNRKYTLRLRYNGFYLALGCQVGHKCKFFQWCDDEICVDIEAEAIDFNP
ncbi:uncharacterized protein LOC142642784 isoform X2 [Castanea sativa]|uniref:uncharacterized protein LOC142642784 isoform X2 n=1 Tax=Castanea sativa TaxID=21020 RepID=UPI003F64CAA6